MAYITPTAEREELGGGVFRTTISLAPVAYEDAGGNLQAISDRWGDGDATYPHVISAARLRVRTAPNGDRLLLPVPGDDDAWFSISSPFINNGTNWIQPSLGSFSRSGNQLTATAANVITRINHAGHYIKAEYELLNGWTPANGQFAYRVGLQGLTRQGGTLLYNGVPVMQLRKPVAYDADNPDDTREITHDFVQLGGNSYILFTLPSLAGMSRPVVDPTFTAQPDGTAGVDTVIISSVPTLNYGAASSAVYVGTFTGPQKNRTLIKFDMSSIPAGATISSATLSLYAVADQADYAHTLQVYRVKRAWAEGTGNGSATGDGATWNTYDGSNSWGTAGADNTTTDREASPIGTKALTATETLNEFKDISLTGTSKADLDLGYGWIIISSDETNVPARYGYRPSEYGTAADRPKLVIEYTTGPTYTLTAAAGSATFTGQAANLLAGRKLTAAAGSATFTGQAANLLAGRKLTAAAGSATFTGQAAGLRANRKLTAAAGSLTLTGYDAALNYSGVEIAVNANVYIRETASAIVEV